MKRAKYNILVKAIQEQQINYHFQGNKLLDAINFVAFSEALLDPMDSFQ